MDKSNKGILVASAVASLLFACGGSNTNAPSSATPSAGDMAGKVKCVGINACAGKGACAQAGHACGGKNTCKGQGVTLTTADDCTAKGGKQI